MGLAHVKCTVTTPPLHLLNHLLFHILLNLVAQENGTGRWFLAYSTWFDDTGEPIFPPVLLGSELEQNWEFHSPTAVTATQEIRVACKADSWSPPAWCDSMRSTGELCRGRFFRLYLLGRPLSGSQTGQFMALQLHCGKADLSCTARSACAALWRKGSSFHPCHMLCAPL